MVFGNASSSLGMGLKSKYESGDSVLGILIQEQPVLAMESSNEIKSSWSQMRTIEYHFLFFLNCSIWEAVTIFQLVSNWIFTVHIS